MTAAPFVILPDTREQRMPPLPNGCIYAAPTTLREGDYTTRELFDRARIERKSISDLVSSFTHGRERFEREADRLRAFQFRCIVVEGSAASASRLGMHPASLLGTLASLHARWGLPTIFLESPEACGRYIAGVLRRLEEERSQETSLTATEIERINLLSLDLGSRSRAAARLDVDLCELDAAERLSLPTTIARIRARLADLRDEGAA